MQYLLHPLGGICLPSPRWPVPQWPAALRRTARRLAGAARRHAGTVRKLSIYTATGVGTGCVGLTAGLSPVEAVSLGLNVAGATAALWPLSPVPLSPARPANELGTAADASS
ncbi:hypothetical protein OG352_14220 [Streptomyces sp. NBC_01485]|uniref:hypothetical protein n=1 Tax=Streptomyces sp. NBC_01485 TaxID=2903884 RepID=UPI002E3489E1|nr:hypothetical protein [Streptomyces sp. NBC_01485]